MATTDKSEGTRPRTGDLGDPSVLAVVVTHQGREWLKHCLIALAGQSYENLDVLVIDDATPDHRRPPALKRIAKRHLRRRRWGFVRTSRPLGFGGAINWAMARVRSDADFLLFVHDDAVLSRTAVAAMLHRMRTDPDSAIVGPKVVGWDDPSALEEVGMAADQFGYPYKGLEEGEIDLGQHDVASEVFFVTSTCMLVRHQVFKQLRGWDAGMRAFAEDLDLCWRARVAGHTVRVEPEAVVRHAIALAGGLRRSPYRPIRYFIRRNRLRAVLKNASGLRLIGLVPAFVLMAIAEMVTFLLLRQPGETLALARALGWNLAHLPQTVGERARAQRLRKVPDRALRPLMVRQHVRLRAYLNQQAERAEHAWGRRAEIVARRVAQARAIGRRLKGLPGTAAALAVLALVLGFRHFLFAPSASLGELLPFPDRAMALWRAFVSPWHAVGLGQPGPASPAFVVLGIFPVATLGAAGAAQKLMVLTLGGLAFVGAYRLVADLVDRAGRVTAGFAYAFGAVGYTAMRNGRLGVLFLGATAPFVLQALLRLNGWMRPAGWRRSRAVGRVALGAAVSAAFVPGSLFLYLVAGAALAAARLTVDRREKALRNLTATTFALVVGWLLLLPWSAGWWSEGGPLDLLWGSTGDRFAAAYAGHGMASTLAGQTPRGLPLLGATLPLLGILALLIGEDQRRRAAVALWGVVVTGGLVVAATARGVIPPLVSGPAEAGVLPALAFAALAGLAVGAFRLDLPRRGLGPGHALSVAALALAGLLAAVSIGPALLRGDWRTGAGAAVANAQVVDQITSVLAAESDRLGPFRTLWVGERWGPPQPSVERPVAAHSVSGPRGPVLADLFERTRQPADLALKRVIASVEEGSTDEAGRLLGAFNIHHVVVARKDPALEAAWLAQRDLAIARSESEYLLLEGRAFLPRAAVYPALPEQIAGIDAADARVGAGSPPSGAAALTAERTWRFRADGVAGPGVLVVTEEEDPRWTATIDGARLERAEGGWANSFAIPQTGRGEVVVERPRTVRDVVLFLVVAAAWFVVVGAAFGKQPSRLGRGARRRRLQGAS